VKTAHRESDPAGGELKDIGYPPNCECPDREMPRRRIPKRVPVRPNVRVQTAIDAVAEIHTVLLRQVPGALYPQVPSTARCPALPYHSASPGGTAEISLV
jgi:hypothetical protein